MYKSKPSNFKNIEDSPQRLFFFGIDSATWDLIIPWVKQGKLPGFAKFIKQGLTTDLYSTTPPLTPIAWSTLYTGVNPGKHGLFGFYRFDKKKQITINLAFDRKLPTMFNLLSKAGLKVASLNMPFTFPVEPVNGIMLSGFLTPDLKANYIYPKELGKRFAKIFPNHSFTEKSRYGMDKKSQDNYFNELIHSVKEKIRVFNWIEEQDNWNLFAINFMEVDHVQHWFWNKKNKMLKVYQAIDQYLLTKLKENKYNTYLLFSDHGAGEYIKNLNLNTYFLKNGLLKLKPTVTVRLKKLLFDIGFTPNNIAKLALMLNRLPSSQKGRGKAQKIKLFLDLNDIDYKNSIALSFGYYGSIYLIKKDKKSKELVIKALNKLKYKDKYVMDNVWEKYEIYKGPELKNAPDIIFSPNEYAFGSSAISPFLSNKIFSTPHTLKTGEHRFKGLLAIYPKFKIYKLGSSKLRSSKLITIPDVTATIFDYFNIPIPKYFDGMSVLKNRSDQISDNTDGINQISV